MLPTLAGVEELHVEPGTQAGAVKTLRGKGMPRLRSTGRVDGHGDLMVHVDVAVPTNLTKEQSDLLRQLAEGPEVPADVAAAARAAARILDRGIVLDSALI